MKNNKGKVHYALFDISGRLVKKEIFPGKARIDAGSLVKGIYSLRVMDEKGITASKKLVKL